MCKGIVDQHRPWSPKNRSRQQQPQTVAAESFEGHIRGIAQRTGLQEGIRNTIYPIVVAEPSSTPDGTVWREGVQRLSLSKTLFGDSRIAAEVIYLTVARAVMRLMTGAVSKSKMTRSI